MTIEHANITDPEIHEPKGVSSAQADKVYVSDGLGSGSWQEQKLKNQNAASQGMVAVADGSGSVTWKYYPEGWGFYKDNGANQVFNTTPAKLTNTGLGSTTNTSYLPYQIRGSGNLWDSTTNTITPIAEGDSYQVRLDLPVVSETGSPTEVTIQLDIGGSATVTIPIVTKFLATGRTTPYTISTSFNIFCLATFFANDGQLFLNTDTGTVNISQPGITITRTSAGDF